MVHHFERKHSTFKWHPRFIHVLVTISFILQLASSKRGKEDSVGELLRNLHHNHCLTHTHRLEEEQNLIAFQWKQQIFNKTFKEISKYVELLTWYGSEYGNDLGITTQLPPKKEYIQKIKVVSNLDVLALHKLFLISI